LFVERAGLLEREDRFEDSLAAARKALAVRPWFRPAVQAAAHVLQMLERDREALELLTEAARHLESPPVLAQLGLLQTELGLYGDARRSYERCAEMMPLPSREMSTWLTARQTDLACYERDLGRAAEHARQVPRDPFYERLVTRLAGTPAD